MPNPSTPGVSSRHGLRLAIVHHLGLRVVRWRAARVDASTSTRVDLALHAAILRATHNGLLAQMTEANITALGASPVSAFRASGRPESTNRAHRLAVEAIGRADPAGARESMEALIATTAREAGRVITATDVDGRSATGRNT